MSFRRLKYFWDHCHQMGGQHNNDWVKTNFDIKLGSKAWGVGGGGEKKYIIQSLSAKTISVALFHEALQQSMN